MKADNNIKQEIKSLGVKERVFLTVGENYFRNANEFVTKIEHQNVTVIAHIFI